ncbi:MAG: terminase large subunit domain-containing protein [Phycisphaerae bacterium]
MIRLLRYQQLLFEDTARVIVACWCRQAGKDFTAACKAVSHAMSTGQAWFIVSMTQRQADATFDKCKRVAEAYKHLLKLTGEMTSTDAQYSEFVSDIEQNFRCTARTLHLPRGGSVTALPGRNPDTLAGLTGNVIFTEFGLFDRGGYDHWRVVFPLTTRGYQVMVISTPRGRNTKFYDLVSAPDMYSVHFVDINRAVADGLVLRDNEGRPITVEQFRKVYGDELGWQREFLCQFTGDLDSLVKWAQLVAAGRAQVESGAEFDLLRIAGGNGWKSGFFKRLAQIEGRAEMGWDVARHSNLSVLWVNAAPTALTRPRSLRFLVLMSDTSFALQRSIIQEAMDANPRSVGCGDATGLGMDSNETLSAKYCERWIGHTFTAGGWREIASLMVTTFGDGAQAIPPPDGPHKFIATDIYAMQKETGSRGEVLRVEATPNPLLDESHCDIGCACGLAAKAGNIKAAHADLWVPQW